MNFEQFHKKQGPPQIQGVITPSEDSRFLNVTYKEKGEKITERVVVDHPGDFNPGDTITFTPQGPYAVDGERGHFVLYGTAEKHKPFISASDARRAKV